MTVHKVNNKIDMLFFIVFSLLLFIVYAFQLNNCNIIYILGDEYGYWADAFYFRGINWNGTASHNLYYSFGYSILLSGLCTISDYAIRYKLALLINVLFQYISFIYLIKSANYLFPNVSKRLNYFLSFFVSLYTANIFQSHVTLAETLLYLLYVLIFYCVVKVYVAGNNYYYVILGFLSGYIAVVHMRSIIIPLAIVAIVLFDGMLSRKDLLLKSICFLLIISWFVALFTIRNDLQTTLYSTPDETIAEAVNDTEPLKEEVSINDNDNQKEILNAAGFAAQFNKLFSILSWNGLQNLSISIMGKLFYMFVATLFLAPLGFLIIFQRVYKNNTSTKMVYIFVAITTLLVFLMQAVVMCGPSGTYEIEDMLIYGRYAEYVYGVLLLIGAEAFIESFSLKKWLSLISLFLLTTLFVIHEFALVPKGVAREANISGLTYLAYNSKLVCYEGWEKVLCVKAIGIAAIMAFLSMFYEKKRLIIAKILPLVLIGYIWIESAMLLTDLHQSIRDKYEEDYDIVTYLHENQIDSVYLLYDEDYTDFDKHRPDVIQFLAPNVKIQYITADQKDIYSEQYIVTKKVSYYKHRLRNKEYEIVSESNDYYLLAKLESD